MFRIFYIVHVFNNINEIEQNFANQKSSCMEKYPRNSKIVRDLQNSLFIQKMFADSKNDLAFQKMFMNFKNCSTHFQKNVLRF